MSNFYNRRNIIIGLLITLAIVSFFVWYTYRNMKREERESEKVALTLQSLRSLEDIMDDMQDIETGQRGYVISGNREFLGPYNAGLQKMRQDSLALKELLKTYPTRTGAVQQLLHLVRQKISIAASAVEGMERGYDREFQQVQSTTGRLVMDSIRGAIQAIESEDRQVLQQSNSRRESAAAATTQLFMILAVVFLIVLCTLFWIITRWVSSREKYAHEVAHLAGLVENTSDIIISIDSDGNILSWNKAAEKVYGFKKDEVIGRKAGTITKSSIDAEKAIAIRKEAAEKGNVVVEAMHATKDGIPLWFHISVTALRNDSGVLQGYVSVLKDITERKKNEQFLQQFNEELNRQVEQKTLEIQELYERFRSMIEQASEAIFIMDYDARYSDINESASQLTGYSRNELIGMSVEQLQAGNDLPVVKQNDKELKAGKSIIRNRHLKRKDGTIVEIEASFKMLSNGQVMAIARDLTERRKAEEAIRSSEAIQRLIMESALDAIVCSDTGGIITVWTPQAEKVFGWKADEITGKSLADTIIPHRYRQAHINGMKHYLATGEGPVLNKVLEISAIDKTGREFPIELSIVPVKRPEGNFFCAFIRDVSEKVKTKESYEALVNSVEGIVWEADAASYRFNFVSKQAERLLGYPIEDWLHTPDFWTHHIHPDDRNWAVEYCKKSTTEKSSFSFEYRMLSREGQVVWLRDVVTVVREDNHPVRLRGIMMDITAKKEYEQDIIRSNARFHIISSATSDIVWDWDLTNDKLWWNVNYYQTLGYEKKSETVPITDWYQQIHPDDLERAKESIGMALAGEDSNWREEYRFRKADGTYLHFLDRGFIMRNKNGIPTRMIGSMTDLTPIHAAQRKLIESENRLRTILDTDPECIKLMDIEGHLVDINKAGLAMIDADHISQVKGQGMLPLVVTDKQRNEAARMIREAFNGGSGRLEFEIRTLKGNYRWFEINIVPFRNPEGDIIYALGVTRDVTDKKKAEIDIRFKEEKYRTVVEQAGDAIALYDVAGQIIDVNTGAECLLGYTKEEFSKMNLEQVLIPEEVQDNPIRYDVLQTGLSTIKQRKLRRKDGSVVETEVHSQQLPDGRFLSVVRDLTERLKVQRQFEKEKELSDSIINSMPGVFYFFDHTGKFLRWNQVFQDVTGYSAEEISRMHPLDFFEGDDVPYISARIAEVFEKGTSDAEADFITKDKRHIPYYFTGASIVVDGVPCLLGMGVDITDRKKAEKEIEDSYIAIRELTNHLQHIREEERSHIAREIHDELGQQLTVLKMDVAWLNKKLGEADKPVRDRISELLSMLDQTVKSVRRIASELRPSLLDDLGLVAAMEWQAGEFQKRSGIRTEVVVSGTEIKLSDKIKTALFRVFQESLTNVARHSGASSVSVSLDFAGEDLRLSISDNGKGFDLDKKQGERTLGILGMKERAVMVNGKYTINSVPGSGTTVTVTIPGEYAL